MGDDGMDDPHSRDSNALFRVATRWAKWPKVGSLNGPFKVGYLKKGPFQVGYS